MQFDFKKLLPHLYIILGFVAVASLFSMPQFNGMVLFQSDIVSWKASAKEAMDWYEKTGEVPLWSNSMFSGMPTFTHVVMETNNYIYYIQEAIFGVLPKPAGYLFLAMLGFYVLMMVMGINRWLAGAGAIAYAFSTYNITLIAAGHDTKMWALSYMPAVLGGLMLLYRRKWWSGLPVLGISLALLMSSGHYQVIYYTIIVILAATIVYFIEAMREKKLKEFFISSAVALAVALVAIGPNLQMLLSTLEYNKVTMRGGESELTLNHDKDKTNKGGGLDKEYAFRWSNDWGESFTVLVPMLYGGASSEALGDNSDTYDKLTSIGVPAQSADGFVQNLPTYWGDQPFTGGPFYFGAIICFLFVLGLFVIRSIHKWWIVAVCILTFLMSLGYHFSSFNYFLFDTLPGFNKFRVPNMILIVPQMLFPMLGIWALNDILKDKLTKEEIWKYAKLSGIITAGLALLLSVGGSIFFSYKGKTDERIQQQLSQSLQNEDMAKQVVSAIQSDRSSMAMKSGITSVVFIALMIGLLWAYSKDKVKGQYVAFAVIALVAIDLIRVDTRYLNEENFVYEEDMDRRMEPRPVDRQIMQDPDPYYRVLDLSKDTYNDAIQAAHHKAIGGYSPAKMEIYQDMIDIHMNPSKYNAEVLNMLNTKYIISPQGQGGQPMAIPNPNANGNAWFVSEIKWVETADEEMLALEAPSLGEPADTTGTAFNSKETAVVRNTFKSELEGYNFGKDSAANIKLTEYGLNSLKFYSQNGKDGFGVFSDIYYPYGWTAYIDGNETPIFKANYLLRAIKIPKGEHVIEFKFHPKTFFRAGTVSLITSMLLILMTLASIYMMFKQKKEA
ncbi:MAG: YfhO family protein [Chitinophagales bacterium]|nr:YfhO family protein [Chitinophagaceae bacterium]MCB9065679.1 YfhO family protein [Chitinophagales bacterium]